MKKLVVIFSILIVLLSGCSSIDEKMTIHSTKFVENNGIPYTEIILKSRSNSNYNKYDNIYAFKIDGYYYPVDWVDDIFDDELDDYVYYYTVYMPLFRPVDPEETLYGEAFDVVYYPPRTELVVEEYLYGNQRNVFGIFSNYIGEEGFKEGASSREMEQSFKVPASRFVSEEDFIGPYMMLLENYYYYYSSEERAHYYYKDGYSEGAVWVINQTVGFLGVFTYPEDVNELTVGLVAMFDDLSEYDIIALDYSDFTPVPVASLSCEEEYTDENLNDQVAFFCSLLDEGIVEQTGAFYEEITSYIYEYK